MNVILAVEGLLSHFNGSIDISINTSGTNTAGETYSLECSATVTGSTDQPTFTWLVNGCGITSDSTRMVSTTRNSEHDSNTSNLTFNPLAARGMVGRTLEHSTLDITLEGEF